jgi:oligoendopeptidase F
MLFTNENSICMNVATSASPDAQIVDLPQWNLADLYPSIDGPEIMGDLARAAERAATFERRWKGKLTDEARDPKQGGLGAAIKEYEDWKS